MAFFSVCSQLWERVFGVGGPVFSSSSQLWEFSNFGDLKSGLESAHLSPGTGLVTPAAFPAASPPGALRRRPIFPC